MKKGRVAKLLKDYQGYIILIISSLLAIIKPIRLWLIEVFNTTVFLKVWSLLVILLLVVLIIYLIKILRERKQYECKFEIGSSVQHKGYNLKMTVVEYNPYKNLVLCSWMKNSVHNEKWYNQNALEEYEPFEYPLPSRTRRGSSIW